MDNRKQSFEDAAAWCEQYTEDLYGREVGMTLGALLRALGRRATLAEQLPGTTSTAEEHHLDARAEALLVQLASHITTVCGPTPETGESDFDVGPGPVRTAAPASSRPNVIYDPGPGRER